MMSVNIHWFAHSSFMLTADENKILIDPFLTNNPGTSASADDISPDVILVSHAHSDHSADVLPIAKRTGALVACNFEMGNWFRAHGLSSIVQGNPGGSYHGDFFSVKWTIAHHSSSFPDGAYGGQPNGFIISLGGKKLYFAGDTSLFGDMSLIGEEGLDLAFLPIGDLFTMGLDDSIRAIKRLAPRYVIPMHYNTFPAIAQDADQWAQRVSRETGAQPIVLAPDSDYTL